MDYFRDDGKRVKVLDRDFLAEGGEGKLYVKKDRVYKIWHDDHQLVPVAKLHELQQLDHAQIVRPLSALYDTSGNARGYMMSRVPQGAITLPRLFTTSYWLANNINLQMIMELVQNIREVIAFIHGKGFLQVDGNEFNYLVTDKYRRPWFVDVDSYQTPGYPATGIMLSVRDYTRDHFDEGTDWYSFAVVAFQLLSGIHPYKGRHPDYKKGKLEARVRNHASVLDTGVGLPPSVRDFNRIPRTWLDWFKAVFVRGERLPAPDGKVRVDVSRQARIIEDGKQVEIRTLAKYSDPVSEFRHHNGRWVVRAGDSLYVGQQRYTWPTGAQDYIMDLAGNPVFLKITDGKLVLLAKKTPGDKQTGITVSTDADQVFVFDNIAYVLNGENLMELDYHELGGSRQLAVTSVRKILPHATTRYAGMLAQSVMGRIHLMLPGGKGRMWIVAVPELDQYRIVDAIYRSGVAVFRVADSNGQYKHIRLLFDAQKTTYDMEELAETEDVMNFVVLDKGRGGNVLVSLPGDNRMELMKVTTITAGEETEIRVIEDDRIQSEMRLVNDANRVAFFNDKAIYSIKMK